VRVLAEVVLFISLRASFRIEEVDWQDDNICVMGKVLIAPPYKPDDIKGASDSKAVIHVRKIVRMNLTRQRVRDRLALLD